MSSSDMRWSATRSRRHRRLVRRRGRPRRGRVRRGRSPRPRAMPVSRAWPMPSPVIGSVAAAASPTNSARPARERHARRRGPGSARPDGGRLGAGRRARAPRRCAAGRAARATARFMSWVASLPPRWMPKPDVGPAVGQRERPGVAGQQVGLEPHPQVVAAAGPTSVKYCRKACHSPEVARLRATPSSLRTGDHMPSARDDVPGVDLALDVAVPGSHDHPIGAALGAVDRVRPRAPSPRRDGPGRAARRRGRSAGRPRRTRRARGAAGSRAVRPDGDDHHRRRRPVVHDGDRRRARARAPRAGAGRRWSARRRRSCPAGTWPCRRARPAARLAPA